MEFASADFVLILVFVLAQNPRGEDAIGFHCLGSAEEVVEFLWVGFVSGAAAFRGNPKIP